VPAIHEMKQKHGLKLSDFDLIELNEAFAAQVLAWDRELHLDPEKLNVNRGAIALGHPIGCTGTPISVTLVDEMLKRKARRGPAALCVSGGIGMALAIESLS
jgi:acetyl-CoA C-acetyltransferase